MHELENKRGIATPFRRGYLPQYPGKFKTAVAKIRRKTGNDGWWFTKEQKSQKLQSKERLSGSLAAREYGSASARQDLPLQRTIVAGREDIARNFERINDVNKYVKKTKWEKVGHILGAPTRAWKKSVLLGTPAWYANNEIFNQIQGVTAGGLKFIKNQRGTGKYLEHIRTNAVNRLEPSAARAMTADIASNVSKEVGNGRLARMASKQENRSRIALSRTFRQKGLSHEKAVTKLNRNLFDYKVKNWERPIKSVMPFWSWSKNLGKAGARLPFEKPRTAIAANRLDQYQTGQYEREFEGMRSKLKQQGYSDTEIDGFKEEMRKYYKGRIKVGGKWHTTPFNAFSERGMSGIGVNPYLAALSESALSEDNFGKKVSLLIGDLLSRLVSKFPQAQLGNQAWKAKQVQFGKLKTV